MNQPRKTARPAIFAGLALIAAFTLSIAQAGAPPPIAIPAAQVPIPVAHPNLLLDLSIEFPTVGAGYRNAFNTDVNYFGYFDPNRCYKYTLNGRDAATLPRDAARPAQAGPTGPGGDRNRYFYSYALAAAHHKCDGKGFSGNFMNWSMSSAIDMLRLTMTGGHRMFDEAGRVVLRRAFLPLNFYNHDFYFPHKLIVQTDSLKISDVTPFKDAALYSISCADRILFTSNRPPDNLGSLEDRSTFCYANDPKDFGASGVKNRGDYIAQVEVCTDSEGDTRRDLCRRFPDNHFKPIGEIQKNADIMHFGAFGYLLDDTQRRYGGVLRAPLKYVGPKRYTPLLVEQDNPAKEWDETTGQLLPNPDNDTIKRSGVINYLNEFGKNGDYKFWDPIAELYYESLRYLQGLGPTGDATRGITTAMKDGFPVYDKWQDPIAQACQRNSIILIGDAISNYDYYVPGNDRLVGYTQDGPGATAEQPRGIEKTAPATQFNVVDWTNRIGSQESVAHDPNPTARPWLNNLAGKNTGLVNPDGSQRGSYYLPGLAYWANVNPIRTDDKHDIYARTYVIDVDERGNGKIDGSTRGQPGAYNDATAPRDSNLYLAAKYGGYDANDPKGGNRIINPFVPPPGFTGANPATGCYYYLWDQDGNCNPDAYFLAGDGGKFTQSVRRIFKEVTAPAESLAMPAVSSNVVTEGKTTYMYQPGFETGTWGGDLQRRPVTYRPVSAGISGLIIGDPEPHAAPLIAPEPDWKKGDTRKDTRFIFTYHKPTTGNDATTMAYLWGNLSKAQQDLYDTNPADGTSDGLGELRLHYLRGSTDHEVDAAFTPGKPFRPRARDAQGRIVLLGDIINSSPAFAGPPAQDVQGAGYVAFYNQHAKRASAVYVGANDGMLHAFSADLTQEYFAYIPGMVLDPLTRLTDPDYVHRPYVDGGISVAEANLRLSNDSKVDWRTVLAGAMGGGAKGVYALDVTDPEAFKDNATHGKGVLWEFTHADDIDMGYVYAAPAIVKMLAGVIDHRPIYEYYVVVSSGYNNFEGDPRPAAGKNVSAIFLLKLNKPAGDKWVNNVNYRKYVVAEYVKDEVMQNALGAPALVKDPDGVVNYAYAGDLQGRLWRIRFNAADVSDILKVVFTAERDGIAQPITTPPQVAYTPEGGRMILFGTGKYIEASDVNSRQQQSFYAVVDYPDAKNRASLTREALMQRTVSLKNAGADLQIDGTAFTPGRSSKKQGWYVDFLASASAKVAAERSVTPSVLAYGKVFFNTLIPPSTEDCPPASSGRAYALDALGGMSADTDGITGHLATGGVVAAPMIFDLQRATPVAATPDATGRRSVSRTYARATLTGKTSVQSSTQTVNLVSGRLNWREILNYKDLRDAFVP